MAVEAPRTDADVNAVVGGYLRDLAFSQSSQQKMFGYKRAANAILSLDRPLTDLLGPDGDLPRIPGIGPGSTRVIREILETGASPTVEQAIERSERRADIQRRRELRRHFLSRAEVRRVLADAAFDGPTVEQYCGDLQMHSEWSDGVPTVQEIADACVGCVFALDSDAHTTAQLSYAETALAHARLAAIPVNRIVNCWPLERLLAWLSDPSSERRR
jgi:Helix-hairpin-helix domain